jgi:hypothetical protein
MAEVCKKGQKDRVRVICKFATLLLCRYIFFAKYPIPEIVMPKKRFPPHDTSGKEKKLDDWSSMGPGLPDGLFSNHKNKIWVNFGRYLCT